MLGVTEQCSKANAGPFPDFLEVYREGPIGEIDIVNQAKMYIERIKIPYVPLHIL